MISGSEIGIRSFAGNPYDGHTLDEMLLQAETISGVQAITVSVDLGYRGKHDTDAHIIHRGKWLSKRDKKTARTTQLLEALIGHMKFDGLLERRFLKGTAGDAIHTILCGVGLNLRLLRAYM